MSAARRSSSVVAIAATVSTTASLIWLYTPTASTTLVGTNTTHDHYRRPDLECPEVSVRVTSDWHGGSRIALTLSHAVDVAGLELHTANWAKVSSGYKLQVHPMSLDRTSFFAKTLRPASTYDLVVDKEHWDAPAAVTSVRVHLPSKTCSSIVTAASHPSLLPGRNLAATNDINSTANASLAPLPCSWTQERPFSIGFNHMCAINPANAMTCWGLNGFGQATVPPASTFVQVSAYDYHTCALNSTGFPVCWGANYTARANTPLSVVLPPAEPFATISSTFVQVSAYDYHTCALNSTGFPVCWGANYTARANTPLSVVLPPAEPFATISAGALHVCGVTLTGALRCWGANDFNQSSPPAGQYLSVSTGFRHACAVSFPDQRLACWGNCDNGECDPPNATIKYTQVSAGDRYTCAVSVANNATCWGRDLPSMNYTAVPPGQYSFVGTARAGAFSCGLLLNGSAVCWGDRIAYMGLTPAANFSRLALGTRQVCGVTAVNPVTNTGGTLLCFGVVSSMAPAVGFRPKSVGYCVRNTSTTDDSMQSTDPHPHNTTFSNSTWGGNDTITFPPPHDDGVGAGLNLTSYQFRKVAAAGNKFACGVTSTGQAVCWGSTNLGGAASMIVNAVDITASLVYDLMCALRVTGLVTCSSLAIDTSGNFISGAFSAPRDAFVMVSSKGMHTCSLKTTGRIKCWGFNDDRQLNVPDLTYLFVAAGGFHTCAITSKYETLCWGRNSQGQVSGVPVGTKHRYVSCGHEFCCAIRINDMVDCWGSNDFGESQPPANVPVLQIAAGWGHACAVTRTWGLRCWGDNGVGQASPPTGLFYQVTTGTTHSCATAVNGSVVCWGDVVRNQLTPNAAMQQAYTALSTDQLVEAIQRNNSRTRMTCSNLSWGIAYSTNLCANPKTFSGCVPPSTYAGAVARCRDLGGRLPTVPESRAGWLKTALCDISDGLVWTSTTCLMASGESGIVVVSDATQQQSCVPDTTSTAFPICISEREFTSCSLGSRCSQVCVAQPDSQYACSCDAGFSLGSDGMSCFPTVLLRSASTCKQLNRRLLSSSPVCALNTGCTPRMTYTSARTYCRARGARLPLRQEVLGRSDFPFACARDVAVWTDTACASGLSPGFISTTGDAETCSAATDLATVVCVADPDVNECELGTHTCTDKCWNTEGSYTCTCDGAKSLIAAATGGALCKDQSGGSDTIEAITSANGDTVVAPTPPSRPTTSMRSCRQLQWTDLLTDQAICSSSRATPGNPSCPGAVNFTVAAQYCASRGARLPLLNELRSSMDVLVRSNECGYGQRLVWTTTTCSRDQQPTIGVAAAGGGPQLLDKVMCLTTTTQTAFPICVADKLVVGSCAAVGNSVCTQGCVDLADGFRCDCGPSQRLDTDGVTCTNLPPATSPLACDGIPLPWTLSDQNNSTAPCARSFGATPSACSGRVTLPQAQTWCASLGGRLPTAAEVAADVALGSGCRYDYTEVWTSTPCFDATGKVQGVVTSGGSSAGLSFVPPTCSSASTVPPTAFVRCVRDRGAAISHRCSPDSCSQLCFNQGYGFACACNDGFRLQPDGKTCVPTPPAPVSTASCTRLNWNTVAANLTCARIEGNCAAKAKTRVDLANASCTQQGARLPTLAEVMQGATIASTCGDTRVWTSTRCAFVQDGLASTASMTDGWVTVTSSRKQPVCVPGTASYTAACIADAAPVPICTGRCPRDQQCLAVAGTNVTSCVCNPGFNVDGSGVCQPVVATLSTSTCSDLSWGVDSKTGLCASQRLGAIAPNWIVSYLQLVSKSVQNGLRLCLPPTPWSAAVTECGARGARLPTLFEVRAGLRAAYSCPSFIGQRVWTSTTCRNSTTMAVGYIATGLSSWWGPNKEMCLAPEAASAALQCTADSTVDPCTGGMHTCAHTCVSQGGSFACACNDGFRLGENGSCSPAVSVRTPATCAGLQWTRRPGTSICTSGLVTRVLYDGNGTEVASPSVPYVREAWTCSGPVTYAAAVQLCDNLRARLPTMAELANNVVASAGCPDNVDVWTQTSCRPADGDDSAVYRIKGAGARSLLNAFPQSCAATTAADTATPVVLAHVRCVANV